VRNLLIWRDAFYAQRDPNKIVEGWTLAHRAALTYRNVNDLLEKAFGMVNGYRDTLFRTSHASRSPSSATFAV
jgi:hypothetical protein